jgi:Pyruvate/2-oxoacid:ferredoxin oxidoreductase delta subunit
MKAIIHWFSATGNTARAVGILASRLEAAGWTVARVAIAVDGQPTADIPDLTVLAFPIWAWAAPHFVLDYARRLPRAQGARAAIWATCGGFGAQGVGEAARILRRRGYRLVGSGEAVYPDSWTLAVNPPAGEELAQALAKGDVETIIFANIILASKPVRFACAFVHVLWSWPMARLFRTFGRRFMGKFFMADDACTSCGQCAAQCPVRAIRMEGAPARPRWSAVCAGCYRCINLCPARAIQISIARLAIHLALNLGLTVWWFYWVGWLYRQVVPLPGAYGFGLAVLWAIAVFAALTLLQLSAFDALLQWLAARPGLRRFFLRNYTHAFRRYRAPGFRP